MIAWLMEGLALAAVGASCLVLFWLASGSFVFALATMIVVGVLTAASRGDKANH
jgi:hypothetical protein